MRLEIAAALDRKIRLIPALVGGASMPRVGLPNALAKLAQRHAIEISHTRFHQDVDRLIKALEKIIPAGKGRDLSKVEPGRAVQVGINRSFSMPIDAVFQISGRGMVAVGIVKSGTCRIGQEVVLLKDDAELRRCEVASIEAFGKILDKAQAGDRVGILLLGIASKAEIEPGMVLASLG